MLTWMVIWQLPFRCNRVLLPISETWMTSSSATSTSSNIPSYWLNAPMPLRSSNLKLWDYRGANRSDLFSNSHPMYNFLHRRAHGPAFQTPTQCTRPSSTLYWRLNIVHSLGDNAARFFNLHLKQLLLSKHHTQKERKEDRSFQQCTNQVGTDSSSCTSPLHNWEVETHRTVTSPKLQQLFWYTQKNEVDCCCESNVWDKQTELNARKKQRWHRCQLAGSDGGETDERLLARNGQRNPCPPALFLPNQEPRGPKRRRRTAQRNQEGHGAADPRQDLAALEEWKEQRCLPRERRPAGGRRRRGRPMAVAVAAAAQLRGEQAQLELRGEGRYPRRSILGGAVGWWWWSSAARGGGDSWWLGKGTEEQGPSCWGEGRICNFSIALSSFSVSFLKALPFISYINKWSVIDDRHSLTDRRSSWRAVLCLVSGEEKRKLRYSAKISALQFWVLKSESFYKIH
jgi:hypothetical protein